MNNQKVREELIHIGLDYFCDDLDRFTVDEIINRIKNFISQVSKLQGRLMWEDTRDALFQASNDFAQDELDKILLEDYGLLPEDVDGSSRAFFQRLANEMDKAIREVKRKLTE